MYNTAHAFKESSPQDLRKRRGEKKIKDIANRRKSLFGTLKKNNNNSRSMNKIESMSTKEQLDTPTNKPDQSSYFNITRKLRSLGGFNNNDDNEMFFDCIEGDEDKSADLLTSNNKQQSNGEITFMPRTVSKKENEGALTFSDSEVEVEEEEESYFGGRIMCIRRGFGWPVRKQLSETHKNDDDATAQ